MGVCTLYPTEFQMHLFHEGTFYQSYQLFGAHILIEDDRIDTTILCVGT